MSNPSAGSFHILPSWVDQVLAREDNDARFEAFANEVVSVIEGKPIVGTSKSWDLGRDGRGVGNSHGLFVLTSLRTDADKPRTDAERLKSTTRRIKHVYYVAPRVISDAVLEKHADEIRSVLGTDVTVDPLGGPQLADLISSGKASTAFGVHYAGEVAAIKAALAAGTTDAESKHLELALGTFGAENSSDLREALVSRLVLELLSKEALDVHTLASHAASALGVNAFPDTTIDYYCGLLKARKKVELRDGRYWITESGKDTLASSVDEGVATALSGRDSVRRAVEDSLGSALSDQHWNLIWGALQQRLAHAFYVRGKQLLDALSILLDGESREIHRDALAVLVDNVLTDVVATYVSLPLRDRMLRAFQDAFLPGDKYGAFDWLAGVAGRFAASCTLGLTAEVVSSLRQTLSRIRFFFDTDVVISYLCAHEPSHAAAHAVVNLNKRFQNQVMITDAVAEEAARHAMKSHTDYRVRVASVSGPLEWYEIADLESAFTREFEYLRVEGKVRPKDWPRFMQRYSGEEVRVYGRPTPPNTQKMRSLLSSESISIHSPGDQSPRWEHQRDVLARAMFDQAQRLNPDGRPDILEHKSRIDAEMLIAVSRTMADSHSRGTGERYVLITSARRLRNLPSNVRASLPEVPEVLSLAEAAAMAALLPDQPVSLRALHSLLFEGRFAKTVGRLEGLLLRIVRESSSAVLPGATRGVLCEEFRGAILRECKRTGESESELRTRIDRDPVELAKIASVAVDALALSRPVEKDDVLRRLEAALNPKETPGPG